MSKRDWPRALALAGVLLCSQLLWGQETTLSGRIQTVGNRPSHVATPARAEDVMVWLSPIDPQTPPRPFPTGQLRLTQHHKSFEPHLLVVPVGAVVEFPNRDPFFHNVFSLFEGKRFDLGLYEAGSTRNVRFDRPGISYIFCNIHAEMSAVVVALDTPYFGVADRQGDIVIRNVPTGRYTLHVWSETALPATLKAMTREIRVTPETATLGVLRIPGGASLTAHKNKYGMDYEPPAPDSPGYEQPAAVPNSR